MKNLDYLYGLQGFYCYWKLYCETPFLEVLYKGGNPKNKIPNSKMME
jgi:hypothetical protein